MDREAPGEGGGDVDGEREDKGEEGEAEGEEGEAVLSPRTYPCDFYCRCARENFIGRLGTLPSMDLEELWVDISMEGDPPLVSVFNYIGLYILPSFLRSSCLTMEGLR